MIHGGHIEEAEKRLSRAYAIQVGPDAAARVCNRARIDPDSWDRFARHHRAIIRKHVPDLDPRLESTLITMMLHCFATGAVSQRLADRRG